MGKYGYTSNMETSEKMMIAIVRVAESYKKDASRIFESYGLTFAQYTILRVLEGSEDKQNTMGNVSKVMLVSGANTTPIAKRLEEKGFLIKLNDAKDDRLTYLKITPKGLKTIKNIEAEKDELIKKYLVDFSKNSQEDHLRHLRDILHRRTAENEK